MKKIRIIKDYAEIILVVILVITTMLVFTTADVDTQPPNITGMGVMNETDTSAVIYWETSEPATSVINYGTSSNNYNFTYESLSYVTQHALLVQDLTPDTTYYFKVSSADLSGNTATSNESQFETLGDEKSPTWSNLMASPISPSDYDPAMEYEFGVTWTDSSGIDVATININGSEFATTKNSNVYTHNTTLGVGTYTWHSKANDTYGNENISDNSTYIVQKAEPTINLYINSVETNVTVFENDSINISGNLSSGENKLELLIDGNVVDVNESSVSNTSIFSQVGNHTINLRINESENYTSKEITRQIVVKKLTLELTANKETFNIGESVGLTFSFPNSVTIDYEICGPLPESGSGFVECVSRPTLSGVSSPYSVVQRYTNKTGKYIVNSNTSYNGKTLTSSINYTVDNSITTSVSGDKSVLTGEEIELKASASGGVSPYTYTWTLSNGSNITGDTLKAIYNKKEVYNTKITAKDSKGNQKTDSFDITISQKYIVTVKTVDKDDGTIIDGALVDFGGDEDWTDSDGKVYFEVKKGEYTVSVNADDYKTFNKYIDVEDNETFVLNLTKSTSSSSNSFDIFLNSPASNADITSSSVKFSAEIRTDNTATCSLYLNEPGDDWSRILKEFTISQTSDIEHTESISENKEYSWRIECVSNGKTYQSGTRIFRTPQIFTTTADGSQEVVDAGELRRKLEEAITNFDSLDLESKQGADALQLGTKVENAIKDYDRVIRDINNIQFRNDLSDDEKNQKRSEYRDELKNIEKNTPVNIKSSSSESFISYPRDEELKGVASSYADVKSASGTLNFDEYKDFQNQIVVQTKVTFATLEFISGESKEITIIDKTITYESASLDKVFVLESIPKELVDNSDKISFVTDYEEVIAKDPLVLFDKPGRITYYIEGTADKEVTKRAFSILFKDILYSKGGNKFTGAVTLSNLDVTSPTALIILLVVIILIYLIFAYDLHKNLFGSIFNKFRKKRIDNIMKILYDVKENLTKGNVDSANMIFKEVRLNYEKIPVSLKEEIYPEALKVLKSINVSYFKKLFENVEDSSPDKIPQDYLNNLQFAFQEAQEDMNDGLKSAFDEFMRKSSK